MSAVAQLMPLLTQAPAEALLRALPVAVYTTDPDGYITFYNQAAAEFWGRAPVLGQEQWCGSYRLYWPDGQPLPLDECPMAMALKSGEPVRNVEAIVERPDGSRAAFLPFPTPLFDSAGRLTGAINMLVDITERQHADEVKEHFSAIVTSSDDAIISKNLDGIIRSWNQGAERVFGYTAQEAVGQHVSILIPADRLDEEPGIIERIRRGIRIDHYETKRQRKDGSLIDISLTVSPIKNSRGEVIGASKIARDITERKRAEETKELLLQEIKHRVKNTLGTVQAIASQTFRDAPAQERVAFAARLRALSAAHDLLTRRDFDQVSAREMTARALAPFEENRAERIAMRGDDVILNANQGLLLAMAVHELATNAVKYGALSNDSGKVDVDWDIRHADGRYLVFHWRESGGPPVAAPTRKGFGTMLLQRALQQEQGGSRITYAPAGVHCTLEMKL
jgi:PAS domain S-box-containing protein